MKYISILLNSYLNIPLQDFTEKLVSAFMIAEAIDDFNKEDKNSLKYIEENIDEDLQVSFYELDRFVNPTKGFVKRVPKIELISNKLDEDDHKTRECISVTQGQKHLCKAIRKVSEIIVRNTKQYNLEYSRPTDNKKSENLFEFN